MIINSTQTLEVAKNEFIAQTSEDAITDADVIRAANWFYSIVERAVIDAQPNTYRIRSGLTTVPDTGFDISTLANIGSDYKRFEVYVDEVKPQNIRPLRHYSSQGKGYFLEGTTLFMTPNKKAENVIIFYQRKTTRLASSTDLTTVTLAVDQDLEDTFQEYLKTVFYDGQFQFDRKQESEGLFLGKLQAFFGFSAKTRNIYI